MKDKELAKTLLDYYCGGIDDETKNYIWNHYEDYFTEDFFDEIHSAIGWQVRDIADLAAYHIRYEKEHINDKVTLDRETGEMLFNNCRVPAYWYRKGMSERKIKEELQNYKKIWADLNFPAVIQYPLMEHYRSMHEWLVTFGNAPDLFRKMERDLERQDTEEARCLNDALMQNRMLFEIRNIYPWKIKKILRIENRHIENGISAADITMKLYDNSQCKVMVFVNQNGRYRGMTALGRRGFPMMTNRDEKLIEEEVFGTGGLDNA